MSEALHIHSGTDTAHAGHHGDHHGHHQSFVAKYVFSMDHKTIAKQFLITGIVWAIIGGLFSVLFRLQLGYPEQSFPILETFLVTGPRADRYNRNFIMPSSPCTEPYWCFLYWQPDWAEHLLIFLFPFRLVQEIWLLHSWICCRTGFSLWPV